MMLVIHKQKYCTLVFPFSFKDMGKSVFLLCKKYMMNVNYALLHSLFFFLLYFTAILTVHYREITGNKLQVKHCMIHSNMRILIK